MNEIPREDKIKACLSVVAGKSEHGFSCCGHYEEARRVFRVGNHSYSYFGRFRQSRQHRRRILHPAVSTCVRI